jgi:DNA processing protein
MTKPGAELHYQIALTLVKGLGPTLAKRLIAELGSAEAIFKATPDQLLAVERVGRTAIEDLQNPVHLKRAEEELQFLEKHRLKAHFYLDKSYPRRLRHCEDGPLLLFQKGNCNLNATKTLAIVGTRNATDYGKNFTAQLCEGLQNYQPLIVSGMAYGIDAAAHRGALENNIPTVGVMAHGLDKVYPYLHQKMAEEILEQGGALVSEFLGGTKPDRENFPKRNRIIAGMCDATLVVEAAKKGGALITAQLADSYHRDVFALPGRQTDRFSEGCNQLIKSNRAALLTSVKDFEYILGWEQAHKKTVQPQLFASLTGDEQKLYDLLEKENRGLELEYICHQLAKTSSKTLQLLMTLELKGLVRALPGKVYTKG